MNTQARIKTVLTLAAVAMAALAIAAAPAGAEITIDGFDKWLGGNPTTGTFDASASDKLVVIVTGEHGFNQTGGGSISGVTYDGVAMVELINRTTIKPVADDLGTPEDETVLADDNWNAIYYLDNPGSVYTAGLISAAANSRGSMTVIGLSGTADGAGNTAISPRDTSSVELTTSADSIVIASYGMGGSGNTARINNVTVDEPLTFLTKQNNGGTRWWDGHVTSYANGVAAGNEVYSVTDTSAPDADGRTGANLILAEFLTADVSVPGDADGDGDVDAADYIMVKTHFGGAPGAVGNGGDVADGPNGKGQDGVVDWYDLQLLAASYTPAPEAGALVPEPATMGLLAFGAFALIRRRRRS